MLTLKVGQLLSLLTPTIFSFLSIKNSSWLLFILSVLLHFVLILVLPVCRRHENILMFATIIFTSIPINIFLTSKIMFFLAEDMHILRYALWCFILYSTLLSIEQLLMGVIVCMLRPNQENLLPDDDF